MDKKMYNTWMTVTILALEIIGLAFLLVSIFDSGAPTSVLAVGLLFIVLGNVFNLKRVQAMKKEDA